MLMISYPISRDMIYDIMYDVMVLHLWYKELMIYRSMISEHQSQSFKYAIIHYFKVSLIRWHPPPNTRLAVLCRGRLATSTSASPKSATVIRRPPRQGLARYRRPTHPDRQCATLSAKTTKRGLALQSSGLMLYASFPPWSWTGSLQEITTQLGSLHAGGSFQTHQLYHQSCGPPAALYHSWSSSWRVKRGNRLASEDVHEILCTEEV